METYSERNGHYRGTPLVRVHTYGRGGDSGYHRPHLLNIDERRVGQSSGGYHSSRVGMQAIQSYHSNVALQQGVQVCGAMMYFYSMFKLGIVGTIFLIVGVVNVGITSTPTTLQNLPAQNALATVGKVFISIGVIILFISLILGCIGRRRYKDVQNRLKREVNSLHNTTFSPPPDMYPGQGVFHTRSSLHSAYPPQSYPDQNASASDYSVSRMAQRDGIYVSEDRIRSGDKVHTQASAS